MRYTDSSQDEVIITVEEGETLRDAVNAILQASIMLMKPLLVSRLPGWTQVPLSETIAKYIAEWDRTGQTRIEYYGLPCKTEVRTVGADALEFNAWLFNCDRGTPEPMLRLARDILSAKAGGYAGKKLDERLRLLGHERQLDESDWAVRLRVSKLVASNNLQDAVELLYAGPATVWGEMEMLTLHILFVTNDFTKFADDWADDPVTFRKNDAD